MLSDRVPDEYISILPVFPAMSIEGGAAFCRRTWRASRFFHFPRTDRSCEACLLRPPEDENGMKDPAGRTTKKTGISSPAE
jgi:hypothetical protein